MQSMRSARLPPCSCRSCCAAEIFRGVLIAVVRLSGNVRTAGSLGNLNVSGCSSPRIARCLAAWRPKRISRVLSGCDANFNARSRARSFPRGKGRSRIVGLHAWG